MSLSHQYHQPNAPDPVDDESDSDLELTELSELDPVTARPPSQQHQRQSSFNFDFTGRIPLRTLRAGRGRPQRDYDEDEEDALGLLEDGPDRLYDDSAEDGEPLLSRRRSRQQSGTISRIQTSLGLSQNTPDDEPEDEHDPSSNRTVLVGHRQPTRFPINAVSNSRYTPYDFLPRTLYNEFKFFINMYFLLVALSQIIPALRIGYLISYIMPLSLVMTVTLGKEAFDDISRRKRDAEANSEPYTLLRFDATQSQSRNRKGKKRANGSATDVSREAAKGYEEVIRPSRDIKVGDVVKLSKNQRVPADLVLLRSSIVESQTSDDQSSDTGETFIRTDQLDGETDWKLRLPCPLSQGLQISDFTNVKIVAGKPDRKVNEFVGTLQYVQKHDDAYDAPEPEEQSVPLTVENTAWANTVIASSSTVYGVVVYTGSQTRQAMSTTPSRAKVGLLEMEINNLTKILCILTLSISVLLATLGRIENTMQRTWVVAALRFLILFSTVIPISLRINLDMGKVVYAWYIEHDNSIPDTVVRTSTIPEDLGRIEYLLSDKTGTLTQNEMDLRKVHVGTVSYANEAMDEVASYVNQTFGQQQPNSISIQYITPSSVISAHAASATRSRREIGTRVRDLVLALALCHNVTPINEESPLGEQITTYQASSPDEIAIVQWTEAVGLKLVHRDRVSIVLASARTGQVVTRVQILNIFPFTSESKRMGILVKFIQSNDDTSSTVDENSETWFYQKGADTVMSKIVLPSDWLDEETANMAREGLRTLVVGRRQISPAQYTEFAHQYSEASLSLHGRDASMTDVVKNYLEKDLELLGVTGVEDKLQQDVKHSLELLRNAGIKIWMLTGDKVETARCVAISAKLVSRQQTIRIIEKKTKRDEALNELQTLAGNTSSALLIDGDSLTVLLKHNSLEFVAIAARLPAVIACRVSPIQKAQLANLIKEHSGKRICCIGDGGNDVSMIQAADVGVGIVGKEGKQASLAADFSILQFRYLVKLLVWHGRNSYKRSAKLAQFVIHRGVIMSVCQVMFSIASRFGPNALYRDWLMIGYATLYTFAPVFTLVLDRDIDERLCTLYPELYKELTSGKSLSYRTFFVWLGVSIYQGCLIQGLSQLLVSKSLTDNILQMVGVSYTALVLNELSMVGIEITTWHWIMIATILLTVITLFGSYPLLGGYMDLRFVISPGFWWRVGLILFISLGPIYLAKFISRRLRPPTYRKVMHV